MTSLLAAAVAAGILLPHGLRLEAARPATAAALWAVSLGLRAVAGVLIAIAVGFFVPGSAVFDAATHWCWHTVLPLVATHLGLTGHALGAAVIVFPAFLLGASSASIVIGLVRAGGAVRRLLAREVLGRGPEGAVIVGGADVMLAAAGFTRPRLVVSAGALVHLDDDELAAAIAHERGHIVRRHRWILVYGELCRGLGRFIPGAAIAQRQLAFHLERDADRYATRRHDPVALASAICKAGSSRTGPVFGYSMLSGSHGAVCRVDELLDGRSAQRRLRSWTLNGAAVTGTVVLLCTVFAVPAAIVAGHATRDATSVTVHCQT